MMRVSIQFCDVEGKPVDYRALVQWLFWGTPNLQKVCGTHALQERVLTVLEVDLGVDRKVAERLFANARRLGLIEECYWSSGFFSGNFCRGSGEYCYPCVEAPPDAS